MNEKKEYLTIQEAMDKGEGEMYFRGWCYRERKSNKLIFIVIRDQTNIIQCVIEKDLVSEKIWKDANKVTLETSLKIKGTIKKDDRAPSGYEVSVKELELVGELNIFPISRDFSTEFLLDQRHLWIRSRKITAILKIRHTLTGAIHEFFRNKKFFEFHPPIFTPNACEGGSTLFEVKYYDDIVYLTQSWQLYAEAAVFSLGKIYDISPTFRSEKSKTSRHLSEFWMAEMEAAWMHLDECIEISKEELKFIIKKVLDENEEELKILKRDTKILQNVLEKDIPTITYTEALKILKEKENMEVQWGKDLRTIEEDSLMKHYDTPIIIIDYPKEIMAFYKPKRIPKPKEAIDEVALCFDMLAPEGYGEIIGGSERDTDINELGKYLKKQGEKPENYSWYIDLRKYGSVPHSGYGLGVERVLAWICGLDNIKDAIAFPRTMLRKHP